MNRPSTRLGSLMTLRRTAEHAARSTVAELETQRRVIEVWLRARERRIVRACPATALRGSLDPMHLDRQSQAWIQHQVAGPIAGRELAVVQTRLEGARAALEAAALRRQAVERLQKETLAELAAATRRAAELEIAERSAAPMETQP